MTEPWVQVPSRSRATRLRIWWARVFGRTWHHDCASGHRLYYAAFKGAHYLYKVQCARGREMERR